MTTEIEKRGRTQLRALREIVDQGQPLDTTAIEHGIKARGYYRPHTKLLAPTLNQLAREGLVTWEWQSSAHPNGSRRRMFSITEEGRQVLEEAREYGLLS